MMRTGYCVFLLVIALCIVWMDTAAGYPVLGYAPTDDNETAGLIGAIKETVDEPANYYLNTMDKRFNGQAYQPRGPLDDCKSYFDCKGRFIKYLDSLARTAKMG